MQRDVTDVRSRRLGEYKLDVVVVPRAIDRLTLLVADAARQVGDAVGKAWCKDFILCDGGSRYQSKLFNPAFLREKNLPLPRWMA